MPFKSEKIKLPQEYDRRRKLTDDQKDEIRHKHSTGFYSLNNLAKEYIPEAVARDTRLDAEKALIQLAIDILPDIPEKETLRKATTHWKYREQILDLILRLDA